MLSIFIWKPRPREASLPTVLPFVEPQGWSHLSFEGQRHGHVLGTSVGEQSPEQSHGESTTMPSSSPGMQEVLCSLTFLGGGILQGPCSPSGVSPAEPAVLRVVLAGRCCPQAAFGAGAVGHWDAAASAKMAWVCRVGIA